jgi:hypothetical protein
VTLALEQLGGRADLLDLAPVEDDNAVTIDYCPQSTATIVNISLIGRVFPRRTAQW